MSVDAPLTRRRRPISVSESRTAPAEWLDEETLLLAAGVTLGLPSSYGQVTVKALGAGCHLQSSAGVEDITGDYSTAVPTTTDPVPLLAIGETVTVGSSGAASPWYII